MKSVLDLLCLRSKRSPPSPLGPTMFSSDAAIMITGDYTLTDGVVDFLRVQNTDGTKRLERFIKFKSFIAASDRVFHRQSDLTRVPVDVWVPEKSFSDHPISAFANLHGLLYLPDHANLDSVDDGVSSEDRFPKRPLIQVLLAHRYPSSEPGNDVHIISPIVTLVGYVASETRPYENNHSWRVFDLRSSVNMKGEKRETRIGLLLKGVLTAWKPKKGTLIFVLAKFTVPDGNSPLLHVVHVNIMPANMPLLPPMSVEHLEEDEASVQELIGGPDASSSNGSESYVSGEGNKLLAGPSSKTPIRFGASAVAKAVRDVYRRKRVRIMVEEENRDENSKDTDVNSDAPKDGSVKISIDID